MNILVIGNGFDLAHGLPTKYGDFLEWVVDQVYFFGYMSEQEAEITKNVLCPKLNIPDSKLREKKSTTSVKQHEIWECINDNFWLEYFLQCDMYQKENWIDFESEISRVIKSIDDDMRASKFDEYTVVIKCTEPYLSEYFLNNYELLKQAKGFKALAKINNLEKNEGKKCTVSQISEYKNQYEEEHPIEDVKEKITYKQMIQRLEDDLNKLDRALEIYLVDYVGNISDVKRKSEFDNLNPDHVLSFNYSDTYERLYDNKKEIEYDYIHGKADINNTIESNNMVLGIDEYLPIDRKDKEISFIAFKKYYQRIYKGTGCEYKDWMYTIKESAKSIESKLREGYPEQIPFIKFTNDARHNLYIFGHSLDVTDKDILRDLILNDNVYTKIFYYNKADLASKIANLVKVIGQDELIRRTGGSTKTIEFKLQQDMVEKTSIR